MPIEVAGGGVGAIGRAGAAAGETKRRQQLKARTISRIGQEENVRRAQAFQRQMQEIGTEDRIRIQGMAQKHDLSRLQTQQEFQEKMRRMSAEERTEFAKLSQGLNLETLEGQQAFQREMEATRAGVREKERFAEQGFRQEEFDFRLTRQQEAEEDRLRNALADIERDPDFSEEEKTEAKRQILQSMAGIKPTPKRRKPSKYPTGQDVGQVWDLPDGTQVTRDEKGNVKKIAPSTRTTQRDRISAVKEAYNIAFNKETGAIDKDLYQEVLKQMLESQEQGVQGISPVREDPQFVTVGPGGKIQPFQAGQTVDDIATKGGELSRQGQLRDKPQFLPEEPPVEGIDTSRPRLPSEELSLETVAFDGGKLSRVSVDKLLSEKKVHPINQKVVKHVLRKFELAENDVERLKQYRVLKKQIERIEQGLDPLAKISK